MPLTAVRTTAAAFPSQNLLLLGQTTVQSRWNEIPLWIYGLIKDLALPVVLVVLGVFFQSRESKREHERHQTARERDLKSETWKQMLPESHTLAKEYYAPMAGSISGLLQAFDLALKEPDLGKRLPHLRRTFYFLMLLGKCLRVTSHKLGGLYFKDRVGEQLASTCCTDYQLAFLPCDPTKAEEVRSLFQHSLNRIDPRETFVAFKNKLDTQPTDSARVEALLNELELQANEATKKDLKDYCEALQATWKYFCDWHTTPKAQEAIELLRALRAILNYEMNRPYEYWYDRVEKLTLDDPMRNTLRRLAGKIASEMSDPSFPELAEKYLRSGESA